MILQTAEALEQLSGIAKSQIPIFQHLLNQVAH